MAGRRSSRSLAVACSAALLASCLACGLLRSQQSPPGQVTVKVELTPAAVSRKQPKKLRDASNVAVWLVPVDDSGAEKPARAGRPQPPPKLVQRNKTFEPHLLVVPTGTIVQFPNEDPFFHNVFSLYDGKRFDLGLYEAGTSRNVHFDRPGVSILFCNIHPEMSAVVVAVETPYYGASDAQGQVVLTGVPDGRYMMHVWSERSTADSLKQAEAIVNISASARDIGPVRIAENPQFTFAHKNKYGQDYVPPSNAGYSPH